MATGSKTGVSSEIPLSLLAMRGLSGDHSGVAYSLAMQTGSYAP